LLSKAVMQNAASKFTYLIQRSACAVTAQVKDMPLVAKRGRISEVWANAAIIVI
jgi:hypothetical protein